MSPFSISLLPSSRELTLCVNLTSGVASIYETIILDIWLLSASKIATPKSSALPLLNIDVKKIKLNIGRMNNIQRYIRSDVMRLISR